MPIHTVTKHGSSRTGKPLIFVDGKHDYKDAFYLGANTEAPPVGARIDASYVNKPFRNVDYWFLNNWALVPTLPAQSQPTSRAAVPIATEPPASPIFEMPEPSLRFISNVVATAITKGLINTPDEMTRWAAAAYGIAQGAGLEEPSDAPVVTEEHPFNDDIPF